VQRVLRIASEGVTTRLIRELEKIVEPRQEGIQIVRQRFGLARPASKKRKPSKRPR